MARPVISGIPTVGQRLSSSPGAWSGSPPLSISYQWQRCKRTCADVARARSRAYTLTDADANTKLRVLVTARNSAGSAKAVSREAGPVFPSDAQLKAQLRRQFTPSGEGDRIGALLNKGVYTFSFSAPAAARVVITWYYLPKGAKLNKPDRKPRPVLIAIATRKFSKERIVELAIKLTNTGKQILERSTSLKLTVKGSYTPIGHSTVTATKRVALQR